MTITPHFSPPLNIQAALAALISAATTRIWIASYEFNNVVIATNLITKHTAGVEVKMVCDLRESHPRGAAISALRSSGIAVYADDQHRDMHNKFMVIDANIVVTGSYNWTTQAENLNAENIVVIDDAATNAAYATEFNVHLSHSIEFL